MDWKYKLAAFIVCVVSTAGQLAAQDAYLAQIYGDGVHLYFRNDTSTAKCRFDSVINHGSRDPRAYYFRAIIELQGGSSATAQSDITTGAKYELEGRGTYDVWSALARVQGPHRVEFECMRREALLALRKRSVTDRYPLTYPNEDGSGLRGPVDPSRTDLEPNVPSIYGDPSDPFADDEPPAAPLDDDIDPMDDESLDDSDPLTDDEPMDDDPFGEDDAMPADDPQPEVDSEDPFGDDLGAGDDDPFGEEAPAADDGMGDAPLDAATADDIPSEDVPVDDGDPFGDDLGPDEAPAEEVPVGDGSEEDPFGGDDGDDPFGDIFE